MNYKKECSLCNMKGETELYFNKGQYMLRVLCKNSLCIGNRLNIK